MALDPQNTPAVTPTAPAIPAPPPLPATDPLSGAVLQQIGQAAPNPTQELPAEQPTAQTISVPTGGAGKEGLSASLPAPTEIPLNTLRAPASPEGQATVSPENAPAATGPLEVEPAKELEPEVQELQEKIAQHKLNAPQETVISAQTLPGVTPNTVAQPVVVLPLTEKGMAEGKSKNPANSARWLYEWCVRQIRKFTDLVVVYRDDK